MECDTNIIHEKVAIWLIMIIIKNQVVAALNTQIFLQSLLLVSREKGPLAHV